MDEWNQAGRDGDDRARAALLSGLAEVAIREGRLAEADANYRAALPLFRVYGDPRGEVGALEGLATVALARGDSAAALGLRDRALAVARASGKSELVAVALGGRADSLERAGRLGEALGEAQEARSLAAAGPSAERATVRVARLHLRRGEHEHAGAAITALRGSAPELAAELALRRGEQAPGDGSPQVQALVDALGGDPAAALRRLGSPATPSDAVLIALLDHADGRAEAAADRLVFARDALSRTGFAADAALAAVYAAAALADAGRLRVGEALLAEAEDELVHADLALVAADLDLTRAHLALARGDRDTAEVLLGAARGRPESAAPTLRLRFDLLARRLI